MYATHYVSSRFSFFYDFWCAHTDEQLILLFLACFDEPNDDDLLFWILWLTVFVTSLMEWMSLLTFTRLSG